MTTSTTSPRRSWGTGRRLRRSRRHRAAVVPAPVTRRAAVTGLVALLVACGGGAAPADTAPDPALHSVDPTAGATLVTDPRAGSADPTAIWLVTAVSQRPALRTP